jgi:hypothetical protein
VVWFNFFHWRERGNMVERREYHEIEPRADWKTWVEIVSMCVPIIMLGMFWGMMKTDSGYFKEEISDISTKIYDHETRISRGEAVQQEMEKQIPIINAKLDRLIAGRK